MSNVLSRDSCFIVIVTSLLLALAAGGCRPPAPATTLAPPSPAPARPLATSTLQATPASATMTLTVWLPDTFAPRADQPATELIMRQLTSFADSRPDTGVNVRFKRASGPGGLLDLLRTASPVAPAALPDVVVLSLTDLNTAARLGGVLQPLDSWLVAGLAEDWMPFAVSAGQIDGKWYGLPYVVDVEHLAYDTEIFTATAPITWTQILSKNAPYLFPVGSAGTALPDDVVVQYVANGGTLADARGQPMLDEAPLADTLQQFFGLYQAGLIPPDALRFTSTDETWPLFLARKAALTNVRASQYMTIEGSLPWLQYATLPARSGPARSIARGWAWALVARDPARQPRAAALIMWMLTADNTAAWAQAMNLLPARFSALDRDKPTGAYRTFLRQELNRAVSPPPANVMSLVGPVFQRALADVLAGKSTPHEAAGAAAAQLKSTSP